MRTSGVLGLMLVTAAAAPAVAQETTGGGPLTVNGGLIIWTLVVFGLLLFVLRRSAWPVLLAAVRSRERRLEEQIAQAQKDRAEAAALLEEHRKLLAGAKLEAQEILSRAKSVADKERETLLAAARQEYEQLVARARKDIDAEKEKAILALRREAVDLSIAAASKLIEAQLDTEANRRLVTEYLATLAAQR